MINAYVIKLVKNRIEVSAYAESTLTVLKNKGEKEQVYHELEFWSWFKQKIEYKDEELSFVVVTDNEAFLIPDSCQINLHQTSAVDNDSYINNALITLSQDLFVLSFPQRSTPQMDSDTITKEEEIPEEPLGENAIAAYFRKQTQQTLDFKNE